MIPHRRGVAPLFHKTGRARHRCQSGFRFSLVYSWCWWRVKDVSVTTVLRIKIQRYASMILRFRFRHVHALPDNPLHCASTRPLIFRRDGTSTCVDRNAMPHLPKGLHGDALVGFRSWCWRRVKGVSVTGLVITICWFRTQKGSRSRSSLHRHHRPSLDESRIHSRHWFSQSWWWRRSEGQTKSYLVWDALEKQDGGIVRAA